MGKEAYEATQEPTARRLQKAREEGQVARSSDLSSALFLLASVATCIAMMPSFIATLSGLVESGLSASTSDPQLLVESMGWKLLELILVPSLMMFVVAAIAGIVQVGGLFSPQVVAFRFDRIGIFKGNASVFGAKGRMNFLFSIFKFGCGFVAAGAVLVHRSDDIFQLGTSRIMFEDVAIIGSIAIQTVLATIACLLLLGVGDYCWQRYSWKSELRMTRQEVIDEHREHTKKGGHKRRYADWAAKKKTDSFVPSLIVLGNKIAISIRWNAAAMSSPVVIDMKHGDSFEQMANGIAGSTVVVENNVLASKIASSSDVGLGIPALLHGEIASLLIARGRDTR